MFTKKLALKLASNIKSSERRAQLALVLDSYHIKDTSKENTLNLVPKTFKVASYSTTYKQQPQYGYLFTDEANVPLWFELHGTQYTDQMFPTVFTCWKNPLLLPQVVTHQLVIDHLVLGANLMMRGISGPYDARCIPGAVVGVVDYLRPNVILAVGVCLVLLPDDRVKDEGVAVRILHTVDDQLYRLNDTEGVVVPKRLEMPVPVEEKDDKESHNSTHTNETNNDDNNQLESVETERDIKQNNGPVSDPVSELADSVAALSVEDVDNFFTRALLQSIKLDNIETPVSSSTLMSNHILKHVPPPQDEINMKKTSWKKTAKYLKAMDKLGYLSVKGKGDDLTIVKLVSTSDPIIQNFVPIKIKHSTPKNGSGSGSGSGSAKNSNTLQVVKLFKGKSNSLSIFPEIRDPNGFYEAKQLRVYLDQYIRQHQLVNPKNKKQVLLDDNLQKLCKSATQETNLPRDKLNDVLLRSLVKYYQIVSGEDSDDVKAPIVSGEPPKIQVVSETRIGRKIVTRLFNFEPFRIHAARFADELKVKCSGSATIGTNAQNKTEIMVQGPHGKTVIELLKEKGVPVSYIEFEDKTKKKKKSK